MIFSFQAMLTNPDIRVEVKFNGNARTAKLVHVLPSGGAPAQLDSHHITHRMCTSKGACTGL